MLTPCLGFQTIHFVEPNQSNGLREFFKSKISTKSNVDTTKHIPFLQSSHKVFCSPTIFKIKKLLIGYFLSWIIGDDSLTCSFST